MGNKKNARVLAAEFADALDANEEAMGEGAAMSLTCEQFGIDVDDGYDLLILRQEQRP